MDAVIWTQPPELTTGATNLVIVCICAVCAILVSRNRQIHPLRRALWLVFFLIMIPTGVFGFFVHALVLEPETKRIAWIFLSFLLGLTTTSLSITLLFECFGKTHLKTIIVCNVAGEVFFAVIVCLLSGIVSGIHLVFIAYTGIVLAIILVLLIIKSPARPHFRWYIAAILTVVIGGLFELLGDFVFTLVWKFDQGSVCHLAIAAALCLFAVGCRQKERVTS